jgi:hypothetical protein
VDEASYLALHGRIPMESLGELVFKGKTLPTGVYAI